MYIQIDWFQVIPAFLLGIGAHFLFNSYLWPYRHQVYTWVFSFRRDARIGDVVETDLTLERKGYSLGYSYDYRAPLWVSYVISRASKNIDWERDGDFEADPDIPEEYRVHPSDFTNSGYDKGHLAPSAAIDFSQKSNRETFLMSNVVFQHPQLNRQAWRSLENMVQDWIQNKGKMYVVTGPLYGERNQRIKGIPVPQYFYKVIYSSKSVRAIAFLMPNKPIKAKDLWKYALPVSALEESTGYVFLHKLRKWKQRRAKKDHLDWWQQHA